MRLVRVRIAAPAAAASPFACAPSPLGAQALGPANGNPCSPWSNSVADRFLFLGLDDCSALGSPDGRTLDRRDSLATAQMVASVQVGASYGNVLADLGIVDVIVGSDPAVLPPFWQFQRGGCAGPEGLGVSPEISGYTGRAELWVGTPAGSWQFGGHAGPIPDGDRGRLKWSWAVEDPDSPASIAAGVKTYVARITLRQRHLARCACCSEFACFIYHEEHSAFGNWNAVSVYGPSVLLVHRFQGCPTSARPVTWGQVKALDR